MAVFETTAGAQAKVDVALSAIEPRIAAQYDFASTFGNYPTAATLGISSTVTQTTAGNGIGVRWRPHRNMTIAKLIWFTGTTVTGNYDLAILAADGTRLWSKGETAWPLANTAESVTVSPALAVVAGTEYIIVISADNNTATFRGLTTAFNEQGQYVDGTPWARVKTVIHPIPPAVTFVTQSTRVPLVIIREA
jgi:hypothetical protein